MGDSGGPISCGRADGKYEVAGVTSFGDGRCNVPGMPGMSPVSVFVSVFLTVSASVSVYLLSVSVSVSMSFSLSSVSEVGRKVDR